MVFAANAIRDGLAGRSLDRHPGQLQEPFVDLAIAAFKETWPCRR
jgi:hypothetical protein